MPYSRREFLAAAAAMTASAASAVPQRDPPAKPPPAEGPHGLPAGVIARFGSDRFRVPKNIHRVQFDPTGTLLVAADRDIIRGWNPATGQVAFTMAYPEKIDMNSGRVTDRGTIVVLARVSGKDKYEIHHYTGTTGTADIKVPTPLDRVDEAAFTADGGLVAASANGSTAVYHGTTGQEVWKTAVDPERRPSEMLFVPNGGPLVVVHDSEMLLYDAATGKKHSPLSSEKETPKKKKGGKNSRSFTSVVASPDGRRLAAFSKEGTPTVYVWDLATAKLLHALKSDEDGDMPLGFTPDGTTLLTQSNGSIARWNLTDGEKGGVIDIGPTRSLCLSPDATILAAGANDAVVLFDAATGELLPQSADPPGLPCELTFTRGGRLLGKLSEWGGWMSWDVASGAGRRVRPKTVGAAIPIGMAHSEASALYLNDGTPIVWNMLTGKVKQSWKMQANRTTPIHALSADGRTVVAGTIPGITVYDAVTGQAHDLANPRKPEATPNHIVLSANGRTAATAGAGAAYDLYSPASRRHLRSERAALIIDALQLSADGSLVAFHTSLGRPRGDGERYAFLVDEVRTGRRSMETPPDSNDGKVFAISPDNRLLAVAATDAIRIFEIVSGHERQTFATKEMTFGALAFAHDSATLASAGTAGPVLLWDLRGHAHDAATLERAGLEKAWEALAAADPAVALTTMRQLLAVPDLALELFANKRKPVEPPEADRLALLIDQLGVAAFAQREKATRELKALGELAGPALKAARGNESAEIRQRVEQLLEALAKPAPADVRVTRMIEVTEWIGRPAAEKLLTTWAAGAAGARLTAEAAAALARLRG